MANKVVTNIDLGSSILEDAIFRDNVITFAGADTLAPGTIVARDTTTLKFVIFVKGGVTAGNGIPKGIITEEIVSVGGGDVPARIAVEGRFRKERLIIDADGDASNIDGAVIDELRDFGLTPIDVQELQSFDNP